jgi:hypothetical protein
MSRAIVQQTEAGPIKLTARARKAFEALCAVGGNAQLATKLCDLSERQLRRMLAKPEIRALMRQHARDAISKAAPLAAKRMVELMNSDSQRTAFQASELILATEGVRPAPPPGVRANINVGVGFSGVVLNTKEDVEAYGKLKASGAIGGHGAGYVVNWSGHAIDVGGPDDPPRQLRHQPEKVSDDA